MKGIISLFKNKQNDAIFGVKNTTSITGDRLTSYMWIRTPLPL